MLCRATRLLPAVCLFFVLSAGQAAAQGTTALFFQSQPGDYIGAGQTRTYTQADATFTIRSSANAVDGGVVGPSSSFSWYFSFSAPGGAAIAPGVYEAAFRHPFSAGNGLSFSGSGRGCNALTGRFVVLEVVYGSGGAVLRFAADFEQHCEDANAALFGAIRFNSTIGSLTPFGGNYPIYRLSLTPPANGTISGGELNCGSAGAACDFAPATPTSVTLTATADPGHVFAGWTGACTGGATLAVRVHTIKSCSAVFEPIVTSTPRTRALLDYMAGARGPGTPAASEAFSGVNAAWTAALWDRRTLEFNISVRSATGSSTRRLSFSAPKGGVLTPGVTYSATPYPWATATAGIEVGQSCTQFTGRFVVRDLDAPPGGGVLQAAVDFEVHCSDLDPAIFGTVRFNSARHARPFDGDYPRYRLIISSPSHGRVGGAGLDCGGGATTCQADFTQPETVSVTATPDPGYRFAGWTDACHGGETISVGVNTVRPCGVFFEPVTATGERALLRVVSEPGESVLRGGPEVYSLANSLWTESWSNSGGVAFTVAARMAGAETRWYVTFRARSGEKLMPGTYTNASSSGSAVPNMSVEGHGRSCTVVGSSFTVRKFELDSQGRAAKNVAIDFEQHCSSITSPALIGTIEYTAIEPSRLSLDKSTLYFTSTSSGTTSEAQAVRVSNAGRAVSWTVTSSQPWLRVSPASGTGSATLTVSVDPFGPNGAGLHTGSLTITATGLTVPQATVSWRLLPTDGSPPFGSFDTPIALTRDVTGAVALTGWALDDVGVTGVQIWRMPHASDPPAAIFRSFDARNGKVFLGNATLVDGARPDVEALYLLPNRARAGWGYLMLTRGLVWDGRGLFVVYAIATDRDGHITELGSTMFTVNNALATRPFGSIDGPGPGATVSGLSPNTGWVLTPNAGASIPASGVQVAVDGVILNQPLTTSPRADITAGFPQFDTTQAGRGVFIDTTAFADGMHTIGWLVTDSTGKAEGVGSRFFHVANGSSSIAAVPAEGAAALVARDGVRAKRGWDPSEPLEDLPPVDGVFPVEIGELGRIELVFHSDAAFVFDGYSTVLGERRALPTGSTLDRRTGVFTWQPGPGFLGPYDLVFTAIAGDRAVTDWRVRIVVTPGSQPPGR